MLKGGSKKLLFGNERVIVMLSDEPTSIGHIVIAPTQHHPIMEEVPDDIIGYMFQIANKLSTVLFESLQAAGTNIFVQNGVAAGQSKNHFSVNIIPRRENDNINLNWPPKQLTEDELTTALLKLEKYTNNIVVDDRGGGGSAPTPTKAAPVEKIEPEVDEATGEEKENYLLKQLDRMP